MRCQQVSVGVTRCLTGQNPVSKHTFQVHTGSSIGSSAGLSTGDTPLSPTSDDTKCYSLTRLRVQCKMACAVVQTMALAFSLFSLNNGCCHRCWTQQHLEKQHLELQQE